MEPIVLTYSFNSRLSLLQRVVHAARMSDSSAFSNLKKHHISAGIVSINTIEKVLGQFQDYLYNTSSLDKISVDKRCVQLKRIWLQKMQSMNSLPIDSSYSSDLSKFPSDAIQSVITSEDVSPKQCGYPRIVDSQIDSGNSDSDDDPERDISVKRLFEMQHCNGYGVGTSDHSQYAIYRQHYLYNPVPHTIVMNTLKGVPLKYMVRPLMPSAAPVHRGAVKLDSIRINLKTAGKSERNKRVKHQLNIDIVPDNQIKELVDITENEPTEMDADMFDIDDFNNIVSEIQASDISILFDSEDQNETIHLKSTIELNYPTKCRAVVAETTTVSQETLRLMLGITSLV